jgi:plastocyanin
MRRVLVALTAGVLVGMSAPAAPAQSNHAVVIREGSFAPDRLEVRAGDAVEWVNQGERPHSVTSDDGSFDSGALDPGQGFEVRLDIPGTYPYRSTAEGDEDMAGVVVVVPVDDDGSAGSSSDTGAGSEAPEGDGGAAAGSPSPADSEDGASGQAAGAAPGLGSGSRPSSGHVALGQAAAVSIQDDVFVPRQVEVEAGGTVVWEHVGQRPHTVTASDGSFDSGTLETGASFSQTFSEPGTYSYYCRFHGTAGGAGMAGVVIVGGAGEEPGEIGGLAATGSSLLLPVGAAVALLGVGMWTIGLSRRRGSRT